MAGESTKVYHGDGGNRLVILAGGKLTFGGVDYNPTSHRLAKYLVVDLAGVASTSGGGIASVANPEGATVLITRALLYRTTKSTGAATADIGIAADGTTSNDTLLDGVDIGAAEGLDDNIKNKGTNGLERRLWSATQFLTMTGSASSAGLVGKLIIEYLVP